MLKLTTEAVAQLTENQREYVDSLMKIVHRKEKENFIAFCKETFSDEVSFNNFFNSISSDSFVLEDEVNSRKDFRDYLIYLSITKDLLGYSNTSSFSFKEPSYSKESTKFHGFTKVKFKENFNLAASMHLH